MLLRRRPGPDAQRLALVAIVMMMALLAVAACAHIPLTSLLKLRSVDFTTTDFAEMRAAVITPLLLVPAETQTRMTMVIWRDGQSPEDGLRFEAPLQRVEDSSEIRGVSDARRTSGRLHVFRIAAEGLPVMEQVRREVLNRRRAGTRDNHLSLSVEIDGCWTERPGPGAIPVSTYLRTSETGDYVTLTRDLDLRAASPEHDITAQFPICDATSANGG